jgi:hypothetical protein
MLHVVIDTYIQYIIIYSSAYLVEINQGERQGCPLSHTRFNINMGNILRQWQNNLTYHFQMNQNVIDTFLIADDQAITAKTEDLQWALHKNVICKEYNIKISTVKTKVMTFKGSEHVRAKIY